MFIKIHRSVVVNVYYIDVIEKDHLVIDGESLPIGRQYYPSLINKLKIIEWGEVDFHVVQIVAL